MLPSIAKHASQHGIVALKKYGQNFIFDSSLCNKIVKASGLLENQIVLEIGPGTGGLTRSILSICPDSLTIIETDKRCLPLLEEIGSFYPNLNIIKGDALKFDLESLDSNDINIISNLPYSIGTELVIKWLKNANLISSMTLMLQKEVVDRMRAEHGNGSYGRLSVICQLSCKVEKCFDVSSAAFHPAPKVQSAIVKLTPFPDRPAANVLETVELITRLAFGQRRKMLKSSLKPLSKEIDSLLKMINLSPFDRAENLSPTNYLELAKLFLSSN